MPRRTLVAAGRCGRPAVTPRRTARTRPVGRGRSRSPINLSRSRGRTSASDVFISRTLPVADGRGGRFSPTIRRGTLSRHADGRSAVAGGGAAFVAFEAGGYALRRTVSVRRIADAAGSTSGVFQARTRSPVVAGCRIARVAARRTVGRRQWLSATGTVGQVSVVPPPGIMPIPRVIPVRMSPMPTPSGTVQRSVPGPRVVSPPTTPRVGVGIVIVRPHPVRFVEIGRIAPSDVESPVWTKSSEPVSQGEAHFRDRGVVIYVVRVEDFYLAPFLVFGRHGIPVCLFDRCHVVRRAAIIIVSVFVIIPIFLIGILLGVVPGAFGPVGVLGSGVVYAVRFPAHGRDVGIASLDRAAQDGQHDCHLGVS